MAAWGDNTSWQFINKPLVTVKFQYLTVSVMHIVAPIKCMLQKFHCSALTHKNLTIFIVYGKS